MLQNRIFFTKLILLLFNIIAGYFYIDTLVKNERRSVIIENNNSVNAEVKKKYCWNGNRGSSTLDVLYNHRKYIVAVSKKECNDQKLTKNLNFYLDNKSDEIFVKSSVHIRYVYIGFTLFIITLLIWFIPKKYW